MEIKLKDNKTLKIIQDEDIRSPRDEFDNLGTIVHWHPNYNLGDVRSNRADYNSAEENVKGNSNKDDVVIPIYLYDHSGLTVRTTPFDCRWDSGQVGFIKVSKEKIRGEFNVKRVSKKLEDKITEHLENEVKTLDQYLTGDCYGFQIVDNESAEVIDSCYGFYGSNMKDNGLIGELPEEYRVQIEQELKGK